LYLITIVVLGNTVLQLQKVEQLAGGSKLARLLHQPARYLYAMLLSKLLYPVTRRGSLKKASLFFGGSMEVLLPAATDIYLTGGKTHDSEIRLAKFFIAHLKEGDTFLDIGAHFGYFTLLASALVGDKGKVLSIEPSKGSFALLAKNVGAKKNITIFHNAVSDKNEHVNFHEFPVLYSEYNAMDIEKFRQESWIKKYSPQAITVQAVTIDNFLQEHKAEPAIIKIDVEGAEVKAVSGGNNTWQTKAPVLVMEYLDDDNDKTYETAANIMYENGYKSFIILRDGSLKETSDIPGYMKAKNIISENVVFKKHNK
jgi:FkbM family methyltransferase